jgi:hypothetical protein
MQFERLNLIMTGYFVIIILLDLYDIFSVLPNCPKIIGI